MVTGHLVCHLDAFLLGGPDDLNLVPPGHVADLDWSVLERGQQDGEVVLEV